ncbi:MAG: hypothetical protein AB7E81_15715 [Hyphomicrobiaceae bacterium]
MRSEGYRDLVKCSVEIELANGKLLSGVLEKPRSKSFTAFMNADDSFLELNLFDGSVVQVAKASILVCRERTRVKADPLNAEIRGTDADNPLTVLGIKVAENREQVRQAYLNRMRLYHSDRYGGVDLPPEVRSHMESMTKRINIAYHDALSMFEPAGTEQN